MIYIYMYIYIMGYIEWDLNINSRVVDRVFTIKYDQMRG